jgi:hypothetical protein
MAEIQVDKTKYSPYGRQPVLDVLASQGRPVTWVARNTDIAYHIVMRQLKGNNPLTPKLADFLVKVTGKPESELFTPIACLRLYALRLDAESGAS